jgi:hypothetical protein
MPYAAARRSGKANEGGNGSHTVAATNESPVALAASRKGNG